MRSHTDASPSPCGQAPCGLHVSISRQGPSRPARLVHLQTAHMFVLGILALVQTHQCKASRQVLERRPAPWRAPHRCGPASRAARSPAARGGLGRSRRTRTWPTAASGRPGCTAGALPPARPPHHLLPRAGLARGAAALLWVCGCAGSSASPREQGCGGRTGRPEHRT